MERRKLIVGSADFKRTEGKCQGPSACVDVGKGEALSLHLHSCCFGIIGRTVLTIKSGGKKIKKLVLFLVLILIVPAIAYAFSYASGDDPQFKVEATTKNGFLVTYSWAGEGKGPIKCTVNVRVRYGVGNKSKNGTNEEEFTLTREIHNTGNGWADFDGKSDLDNATLSGVSIQNRSCR